jgi:hypothetical protein
MTDYQLVKDDPRTIWWLASYPKSGNTWIRLFLDAYVTGFPLNINSAFQYTYSDTAAVHYRAVSSEPIADLNNYHLLYYRPAALLHILSVVHDREIVLKTHCPRIGIDEGLPLIPRRFTKGAIYLIRDPRDVVCSLAAYMDRPQDWIIDFMASSESTLAQSRNNIGGMLTSYTSHVRSWVQQQDIPVTIFRYEDLLTNPEGGFKAILSILGLELNEQRLQFAIEQTKFENLQELEDKHGFAERAHGGRFFRQGQAGLWKKELTESHIARIEEDNQWVMKQFDYAPSKNNA